MKTWRRKLLHRHSSGTITLSGQIMAACDFLEVREVDITLAGGGILIKPATENVPIIFINGTPCYTWQEVSFMADREWKKTQAVPTENGGDGVGDGGDHAAGADSALF